MSVPPIQPSQPTQRWPLESAVVIVGYCLTAYVVVHVQAGMGGPNLLWLPAGIALSAVLLRGPAMLPAIFFAVLGFNFYSFFWDNASALQSWAATLLTALGTTLQTWVTALMLQRWLHNLQVSTVPDALRFILCTALGCSIAASIGTTALLMQGKIGGDVISLTWFTWWVGDLTGMLVIAPITLVAKHWRKGRREWSLLSLPIIGLGCSFTLVTAFIVKHLDHDARVSEFLSSGVAMGEALQRTLEICHRDLKATQALFYNHNVSREEFHEFVSGQLKQNPSIRSVVWAPRVSNAQRQQFEADASRQHALKYQIYDLQEDNSHVPAADSPEYLPVLLAEPDNSSQPLLGFNLLSDPTRRNAIALASATESPRATRLVRLIHGGKAVVVYWPVYRNEFMPSSAARDSENLRGFVSMALEIGKLARDTLRPFEKREAETWLLDVTNADAPELLYHHVDGQTSPSTQSAMPDVESLRHGLYQETSHRFASREWLLISKPLALHSNLKANGQFLGILIGGLSLTLVLAFYMIGRQRSEHELHARDERLMSQNAVLTQLARFGNDAGNDIDRQLCELIATSAVTLKIERVSIWTLSADHRQLHCKRLFTLSTGEFSEGAVLDVESAPSYFATLEEGRGFATNDAQSDPRTREFTDAYLKPLGITSMLDVPIRIDGKPSGVLCHEHVGPARTWAADEQNFASSIGDLISLVIESDMRRNAEKALQESYLALERKVEERTEELYTANERLRQLDHLKSMFIASMSHELRTPLNAIIGFTGVVLQGISGPLSETQTDHLNRVYGAARHLLALITDVIDISKIEAGYADSYQESFSLNQLLEEAVATIQPLRLEKGLALSTEIDVPVMLVSDRKRLLQCVLNLLSNAVKYTEAGSIAVRLKLAADKFVIEIEDSGIGISAEALTKLFQPFERIDTHLRIKTPGTGLGLYLTRKIMTDLLHGDVTATSTVGKGSIFTLWAPLSPHATETNGKQP